MRCRLRSGATPANHAIINSIRATIMDKRPQQARIETEQRQRAIVRSRRYHEERFAHREKLQDYRLKIEIALRLRNRPKRCSTGTHPGARPPRATSRTTFRLLYRGGCEASLTLSTRRRPCRRRHAGPERTAPHSSHVSFLSICRPQSLRHLSSYTTSTEEVAVNKRDGRWLRHAFRSPIAAFQHPRNFMPCASLGSSRTTRSLCLRMVRSAFPRA